MKNLAEKEKGGKRFKGGMGGGRGKKGRREGMDADEG